MWELLIKAALTSHQCQTKLWYHLTFYAPGASFFFFFLTLVIFPLWKAGPPEGLSRQEAVSSPHAQAQGAHTEVLRLLRLHRKVRKSTSISWGFRQTGRRSHLKIVSFFPSEDGWPPRTGWLPATPVSSVTSASRRCTTMPTATRWVISWPTLTWTAVHLTNTSQWAMSWLNAVQYSLCKIFLKEVVFVKLKRLK